MIDWFPKTRQENVECGSEAVRLYVNRDYTTVRDVFEEDFLLWTESHFKMLSYSVLITICSMLSSEAVPIKKPSGLKMRMSHANYSKAVQENG